MTSMTSDKCVNKNHNRIVGAGNGRPLRVVEAGNSNSAQLNVRVEKKSAQSRESLLENSCKGRVSEEKPREIRNVNAIKSPTAT